MSSEIKHTYSGSINATKQELDNTGPQLLRAVQFLNTTAAVAYLQIFNLPAASVTVGTTAPWLSIGVPASSALVLPIPEQGWRCKGSGLTIAGTTTRTGSTNAGLDVNIGWGE